MMSRIVLFFVLPAVSIGLPGCGGNGDSEGGVSEAARATKALKEFYEAAQEKAGETDSEDILEWARDDLERAGDWEYLITVLESGTPEQVEKELNELGAERWEVFWIEDTGVAKRLYFKRPARSYLKSIPLSQFRKIFSGDSE